MPWQETSPVEERERSLMTKPAVHDDGALRAVRHQPENGLQVARAVRRGRPARLADRSRAPKHCPHRMTSRWRICRRGSGAPDWGPGKLLPWLSHDTADRGQPRAPPAIYRAGRVRAEAPAPAASPPPRSLASDYRAPNDLWAADFKGQFRTGNGVYCYPLTVTDLHSRISGVRRPPLHGGRRRPIFKHLFRETGCPCHSHGQRRPIRVNVLHGLSPLNVWWLRLGIPPTHPARSSAERRARAHA